MAAPRAVRFRRDPCSRPETKEETRVFPSALEPRKTWSLTPTPSFLFFSRFAQAQAQQKQSYLAGVQDALEKVLEWVEANKNIQTCAAQRQGLTNFLHQELDAVESETPEPVPVDLKVRKESRPLSPSETIPHRTGN